MKWFLDMCIILYSAGEGNHSELNKKTKRFIEKKGSNGFLTCYYIKEIDLPKWLKRNRILLREIIRKIKDNSYDLYSSSEAKILRERDKKKGIKLITGFSSVLNNEKDIWHLEKVFLELERRINSFLADYIDEYVIPINKIDSELVSHLLSFINIGQANKNISDARIISSAIQEHNKKDMVIITADKKDWNNELLQEIHNDASLKKKYPSLPKINYIQRF